MRKFFFKFAFLTLLFVLGGFVFAKTSLAATRTWDGGGSTNNWSEAANWSGDTAPVTGDTVIFDSTSTKDSTINSTISLATLNMNAGYTGTLTQAAALTITTSFLHSTTDGVFTWSSGTLTFSGTTAASWDVDTDDTFGAVTINKTSGANLTVTSGDTAIVTSTLTLTDGNIVTGTIEARGDISHGSTFDGGSGTLSITQGSNAINLTASGQLPIVTLSANRTINGPASGTTTFDGLFTMTNGTYTGGAGALTLTGGLTISGGSFTGGAGNIDNNGAFTLSGTGSFTAGSGTFFVAGAWTHTDSSTFTASTGTVTFDSSGGVTIDVNTSETFNNVTFNASATQNKIIASGDTLIVNGALTLTEGNINTGTVEVRGTMAHGAAYDGGTATINITQGAADINLTAGGQLPKVTLNASRNVNGSASGTVTFDGIFTVTSGAFVGGAGNVTLSGGLTLNGGTFTAPSATLTIPDDVTISSGTFNESTGTVLISVATSTWNVDTTETLYNLTLQKGNSGNNLVVSSGDTLVVTGTLTLTEGGFNTGTIDARGNIVQASTFDGGTGTIDFGNDSVAQTYTINGGVGPIVRFDDPDDASDSLSYAAAGELDRLTISSTFSGTVPISNPTDAILSFGNITQEAGVLDGSAQSHWKISALNITGGTFTPPQLVTVYGSNNTSWDVNESETFTNLTIAKSSGFTTTFTSGDIFTVTGTTIFQDGRLGSGGSPRAEGDVTFMSTWDSTAPVPQIVITGSATQTLDLTGATGVHNGSLLIDKSGGQVNLASDLVLDADSKTFIIREGTFNTNGYNLTVTGSGSTMTVEDGGIFKIQGGETITLNGSQPTLDSGSTVTYTGDGDSASDTYTITSLKSTYSNLVLNSTDGATDVFQLGTTLDVNNDLTLTAGTLDAVSGSNYGITVGGDWSNAGTFQSRSGTVTFDGTDQTIAGTNTFYNFTKTATASSTLTLPISATQTFLGTMTLNGMSTSQTLTLASSTPGTKANIDPQGTRTVEYLRIGDNANINATGITCSTSCTDLGNNTGWTFSSGSGSSQPVQIVQPTVITITRPSTAGFKFSAGQKIGITWTSSGPGISSVNLLFSSDDGATYATIAEKEKNDGSYLWTVPDVSTTKGRILIKATDGVLVVATDTNDRPFTIIGTVVTPPPITPPPPVVTPTEPVPVTPPVVDTPVTPPPTDTPVVEQPVVEEPNAWPVETPTVWEPRVGSYVVSDDKDVTRVVYYLAEDENLGLVLKPFLSPQVFFTYQDNFNAVSVVQHEDLSGLVVDGVMLPKPGVVLVKLPTDPRVYAVEATDEGVARRWIATEELAAAIYGKDWSDYVIDLDEITWNTLVEGKAIIDLITVDKSIMKRRVDLWQSFIP